MIMMLADFETVPADFIKNVVLCIAGAAALAYYLKETFWKGDKNPQPFEVTKAKQYVHKDDFDHFANENKREHENIFSKIGGVDRGSGVKISAEVAQIHARINLLDKSNARLEATSETQNEQLKSLDTKLDGMPERVIATLKNTGAI
jgi:hypothetical protein